MATVTGGGATTYINAGSNDASGVAQGLANQVSAGLQSGTLTRTTGLNPPTGNGVLTVSTAGVQVSDQPAVSVDLVNASGNTTGALSVTVVGAGGPNQAVISDGSNLTYFTNGGSGQIITGDGNNFIGTPTVGGGAFSITTGIGNDTITAVSGTNTISPGLGNNLVYTGSANDVIYSTGNDTVSGAGGGTGSDTVFGLGGSVFIGEFAKNLTFVGGAGPATILSGTGTDLIDAGSGPILAAAGTGGRSTISGGTGSVGSTIFGARGGDVLSIHGSGTNLLAAGGGNETLTGAGSSGSNVYFSGVGNSTITGGTGTETFFAGVGNSTINPGSGADLIAIVNGRAGGTVTINNFSSVDHVTLQGYSTTELANDLANQSPNGGSAQITLSDNTKITFTGVASVNSTNFA